MNGNERMKKGDLDEILSKAGGEDESVTAARGMDGAYEIEFNAGSGGEHRFDSAGETATDGVHNTVSDPDELARAALGRTVTDPTGKKKPGTKAEEPAAKQDGRQGADYPMRTTYVPRFTDASEKYHMAQVKRLRNEVLGIKDDPEPEECEPEERSATSEEFSHIPSVDPTEESAVETPAEDAVEVKTGVPEKEENTSALNVFKFKGPEEPEPEPEEEPEPEMPAKPEPEPEEPPKKRTRVSSDDFSIPDPDDEVTIDFTRSRDRREDAARVDADFELIGKSPKNEYRNPRERDAVKDRFLDILMSQRVRFIASLILTLALFVFENIGLFGVDLPDILRIGDTPGAVYIIDLLFSACLFALALPEVASAARSLSRAVVSPELLLPVYLIVFAIYDGVMSTTYNANAPLFGFVYGVCTLTAIIGSYMSRRAEFAAFRILAADGDKLAVDRRMTRALLSENMALDGAVDEYKSRTARIVRTSFIDDFFRRTSRVGENSAHVIIAATVPLGLAVVTGAVMWFLSGDTAKMATSFATVFAFSCPCCMFAVHKIPFRHAQREAVLSSSAFIGETSFSDYSKVDVVTFEDTEIFTKADINLKRIMLYGERGNLTKATQRMAELFEPVGGPLRELFGSSIEFDFSPATDITIEDDGISGVADDGSAIAAGTLDYMRRHGMRFVRPENEGGSSLDSTRVMYAAEDGQVFAKFYIRYSFSDEFTGFLPLMREEHIVPLIYTRDPNVTNGLLKTLTAGADCMRVMKKHTLKSEDDKPVPTMSVGAFATGDRNSAINVIFLAKKYARFQSYLAITELSALAAGAVLSAVLSLGNMSQLIPSVAFGGWQLAWTLIISVISGRTFSKKKHEKEDTYAG